MRGVAFAWLFTAQILELSVLSQGYNLALSGYHLCNKSVVLTASKVVSFQQSFTQNVPCGRFMMFSMCQVTLYQTSYRILLTKTTKEITTCCDGYVQAGSYCVLPFEKASVFTSKPGRCPQQKMSELSTSCQWDTDCPDLQKCCETEGKTECMIPVALAEENSWLYNVTIKIKVVSTALDLKSNLLNLTRLLDSVVTGALSNKNPSVYHIRTYTTGQFNIASQLFIQVRQHMSLDDMYTQLGMLVENIDEVIHVDVEDVNECSHTELKGCSLNAYCSNTVGSYDCECIHGYTETEQGKKGANCIDADECKTGKNDCSPHADCENMIGGYNCMCKKGFNDTDPGYPGRNCTDINECKTGKHSCCPNAICENTEGGYNCFCMHGYKDIDSSNTGMKCEDINECESMNHTCSPFAVCNNTIGGYHCSCKSGFTDEDANNPGKYCKDINECEMGNNTCSPHGTCQNMMGEYSCSCKTGFIDKDPTNPGRKCEVIKECMSGENTCCPGTSCQNASEGINCSDPLPVKDLTFLNITKSSFHATWSADPKVSYIFEVTLLKNQKEINATITALQEWLATDLEPGTLYTLRVVATLCGRASKATESSITTEAIL